VPKSKTSLGGISLVGNMQGFFVAVNGPEPVPPPYGSNAGGNSSEILFWEDIRSKDGVVKR